MWTLKCPKCGAEDDLCVVRGTFSGSIPLREDGFAFADASCVDTEDEVVRCGACGAEFPLSELDAGGGGEAPAVATVWVEVDMRAGQLALAYRAACQAYVEHLGREAGLEVKREIEDGRVYLGVSGTPDLVGGFLVRLARAGIGALTVDLEGGDESVLSGALGEAARELEFELVVL